MKRLAALSLFALAACATTARPDSTWLAGNWCSEDGSTTYAGVSHVGLWPTRFDADGSYDTSEDRGHWELHGRRLTRTTPFINGGTFRSDDRVERLGPDRMAWTWGSGQRELWRRCPPDRQ